jgi:hypothetical protein
MVAYAQHGRKAVGFSIFFDLRVARAMLACWRAGVLVFNFDEKDAD